MHRFLSARAHAGALLLALAGAAHAGSTITVNTATSSIDFAATGNSATTLVRPAWDMTPQAWNGNQPSPSTGVWVPGSGAPTVAQLVTDLATRGDSRVSLREAIAIANATQYAGSETGPTTIVFDTAAMGGVTVTLVGPDNWWYGPNALPPIYADVVIDGGNSVTILRNNPSSSTSNPYRLFYVAGKFHNLVDGKNAGGGLPTNTPGKLTLRNITVSRGLALGGNSYYGGGGAGLGGAIYNQGTLVLDHATLSDNRALGGAAHVSGATLAGGGGLGGDGWRYGGGGMRYHSEGTGDPLPSSGGGFLSFEPRLEGGTAFSGATPGAAGTSRFGGDGYAGGQPIATNPCTTFSGGGGFIRNASSTLRGDGGGYTRHCSGGGGAFGGGGGGYESSSENVAGGGGVGGGGGQGSDGGFGGGAGSNANGGFGGGTGYGFTTAWGFGGGGGAPGGDPNASGGGGAGLGGAVFNHTGSVILVNNSQLASNIAEGGKGYGGGSGYGGALFNLDGSVVVDASSLANNSVIGGANLGGATGNAAGGAIYSRYQNEDVGLNDLADYRSTYLTPSTTQVTLRNGAVLSGSVGGVDCFADAGDRQAAGTDVARLPYFHFDGAYTVGSDAAGINSCTAQDRPGVYFVFAYYDNAANDFANRGWLSPTSDFQKNMEAAGKLWTREFAAGVKLRLVVRVDADNASPRFSANQYTGRISVGGFSGPNGSNSVFRPGALEKVQTGASTAGVYDMLLLPNPAFVDQYYWLDPTPDNRNDNAIPAGRNDLVSVVLHELEHGFGFSSWRHRANDADFGKYDGSVTLFDSLSMLANAGNAASQTFFTGAKTKATYSGQNLPLTYWPAASPNLTSDFDHFATTCTDRDTDTSVDARLRYALMTTCPMPSSGYVSITMPDRAVLQDLGYPMDTIFKTGFARD